MSKKKPVRTRGKLPLSKYFQELKKGDKVSLVKNASVDSNFPDRIQGTTGVVEGKRGNSYIVNIKDNNKLKKHIVKPIHLRKIKNLKKHDK